MPPVASLFLTTLAGTALAAAATGTIVWSSVFLSSAAITGLTYAIGKLSRPGGGGSGEVPLRDRNVTVLQPDPPRKVVYGRCQFSPSAIASYSNGQEATLIFAVADHELSTFHNIKFNDQEFLTTAEMDSLRSTGNAQITSGSATDTVSQLRLDINSNARAIQADGNKVIVKIAYSFEADGDLGDTLDALPYDFPTKGGLTPKELSMKLEGVSWIALNFTRTISSQIDIWNGFPSIQVDVQRNNDTLSLWDGAVPGDYEQGNAALAVYDFLKRYTLYGRPACGMDRIDKDSAVAAAEACNTGNFYANGVFNLTTAPSSVLEQLTFAMNAGATSEQAGIRHLHPGVIPPAVRFHINTDDMIDGSWHFTPTSDISNRVETMEVKFMDSTGTEQSSGVSVETDKLSNRDTIELDFVNNQYRAEQVARIILNRLWSGAGMRCDIVNLSKVPDPNDIVTFDIGLLGLSSTSWFRVVKVELRPDRVVRLECVFEDRNLFVDQDVSTYVVPTRPGGGVTPPGQTGTLWAMQGADGVERTIEVRTTEGQTRNIRIVSVE